MKRRLRKLESPGGQDPKPDISLHMDLLEAPEMRRELDVRIETGSVQKDGG